MREKLSDTVASEERRLKERAAALRAEDAASPAAKVERLVQLLFEVESIHRRVRESASFKIERVDGRGNISVEVGTGIPGGAAFVALKKTKSPKEVGRFLDFLAQALPCGRVVLLQEKSHPGAVSATLQEFVQFFLEGRRIDRLPVENERAGAIRIIKIEQRRLMKHACRT